MAEIRIPAWLETAIEESWCADTAYDPEKWVINVPMRGQCAVTAILLSELCGLLVVRGEYGRKSKHYWNIDAAGNTLDATIEQFTSGVPEFRDVHTVDPKMILANKAMLSRYQLFKEAVLGLEPWIERIE